MVARCFSEAAYSGINRRGRGAGGSSRKMNKSTGSAKKTRRTQTNAEERLRAQDRFTSLSASCLITTENDFWTRNLTRLVLCSIEAKFCNKMCVGKLSPRSTQCTPLHRSLISIFSLKIGDFLLFFANFCKIVQTFAKFAEFLLNFDQFFSGLSQNAAFEIL